MYKEYKLNKKQILDEVKKEEEKFNKTLEKGLNIFGKVRFAYQALTREKIYTSYSDSTQNYKASEKRENINPEVMVGMGYQFSKGVGLNLAYNTIISTSHSTYLRYNPSFNGVLLSLEYKLG